MFNKKLKQRVQYLEARVRGLCAENQLLVVGSNDAKLQVESLRKAVEMYQQRIPIRDSKGRFVKKGVN